MEFLRAKGFSNDYVTPEYADAVLGGYDPRRPYVPFIPPPETPLHPASFEMVLNDEVQNLDLPFAMYKSPEGDSPTSFDFNPFTGSAVLVWLDTSDAAGYNLTCSLSNVTDTVGAANKISIYLGSETTEAFDPVVSNYTLQTDPFSLIEEVRGRYPLVIYHSGDLEVVRGTLTGTLNAVP